MSEAGFDKSRVVVIVPSYNEGVRILNVVKKIKLQGYKNIIVINDNSDDSSEKEIRHEDIVVLHHVMNRGAGAATETGLKYCRDFLDYDTVVTIDADMQHDPSDITLLVEAHLHYHADVSIGNRFLDKSNEIPGITLFFNAIANLTTSILCMTHVRDSQSGFKALSRHAVNTIHLKQDRYAHCSEILIKAHQEKLKVIDVPIKVYYPEDIRNKGQNFINGVKTFFNLVYNVLIKN